MAKFQGRWVTDKTGPHSGFDEMMDHMGMPADMKEFYRGCIEFYDFDINGDKWTLTNGSDKMPGQDKKVEFKLGIKFPGTMPEGSKYQSTFTLDSETQLTEVMENEKYGTFRVVRTIDGDLMNVVDTEVNSGVCMKYRLKKEASK